jgi:hypothetical protein
VYAAFNTSHDHVRVVLPRESAYLRVVDTAAATPFDFLDPLDRVPVTGTLLLAPYSAVVLVGGRGAAALAATTKAPLVAVRVEAAAAAAAAE